MSTTPSIGRIVNYVLPRGVAGGFNVGKIRPLIITEVWDGNRINGKVILDGRNDEGHDDHAYTVDLVPPHPEKGPVEGTWHWPARV